MRLIVKFVQADPKTGRLIYRRAFPEALRPHLLNSRREMKVPLHDKDPTSPALKRRVQALNAQFERETALARATMQQRAKEGAGQFDVVTPELIDYLAGAILSELRTGAEMRLQEGHGAFGAKAWAWLLPQLRKARLAGDRALLADIFEPTIEQLLADESIRMDPQDTEGRSGLVWALCAKLVSAADDFTKQWDGYAPPIPPKPEKPRRAQAAQPEQQADAGETFETIVEALLESHANPISVSTAESTRTALRFFRETHGHPTPREITRAMVADWLELLAKRPARLPKSEADIPLPKVVELYSDRPEVPRLSAKTLLQHQSMLSARWTQAGKRGKVDREAPNPFKDHDTKRPRKKKDPKGFSADELKAIFSLPVFTAGDRPLGGKGEASYWVPLILLFTGARPEEIAQLIVSDIHQDRETKHWLLSITDEGDHPYKGSRSLKTEDRGAGPRTFRLPQPLIDLGLLAYRKELIRAGEVALFPKLRTKGARLKLYAGLGEWWSGYLKENGVHLAGTGRQPMRELRHTWSTAARKARVPREVMAYIQGHALDDATSGEDYGDLSPLGLAVNSMTFDGFDLAKVVPWAPRSDAS